MLSYISREGLGGARPPRYKYFKGDLESLTKRFREKTIATKPIRPSPSVGNVEESNSIRHSTTFFMWGGDGKQHVPSCIIRSAAHSSV